MGQVPTHPLWRPYELVDLEEVAKARVGNPPHRTITVVPYDDTWPAHFADLDARIRGALGDRVLALEHVGSTAVAGLSAKPVIDADLTVADSGDEAAYLPDLEAAGFELRIREPEWEEHRVLTDRDPQDQPARVLTRGTGAAAAHRVPRLATHPRP